MFFVASKILAFLIRPLVWVLIFMGLSLFTEHKKRYLLLSLITLYVFSNTLVFNAVSYSWETEIVKPTEIKDTFQLAVVLGGIASFDEEKSITRFASNADRILNVLPLYFDGRIKKILIAGGSGKLSQDEVEADVLANYLTSIGVDKADLILEKKSRNTYENARYSAAIIQQKFPDQKILLATSSTHMPRALACFQKQNIDCFPFAVDQQNSFADPRFSDAYLPNAEVLNQWYWLFHEWAGLLVYKLKGYC